MFQASSNSKNCFGFEIDTENMCAVLSYLWVNNCVHITYGEVIIVVVSIDLAFPETSGRAPYELETTPC